MDWNAISGALGAIGIIAVVAAALYVGRHKGQSELIEIQQRTADALRREAADDKRRCDRLLAEQAAEINQLKGRVKAVEDRDNAVLADLVAERIARRTESG